MLLKADLKHYFSFNSFLLNNVDSNLTKLYHYGCKIFKRKIEKLTKCLRFTRKSSVINFIIYECFMNRKYFVKTFQFLERKIPQR